MEELLCPKCKKPIRIYPKTGYFACFDLKYANENIVCNVCKRKIAYSIRKINNVEGNNE